MQKLRPVCVPWRIPAAKIYYQLQSRGLNAKSLESRHSRHPILTSFCIRVHCQPRFGPPLLLTVVRHAPAVSVDPAVLNIMNLGYIPGPGQVGAGRLPSKSITDCSPARSDGPYLVPPCSPSPARSSLCQSAAENPVLRTQVTQPQPVHFHRTQNCTFYVMQARR